MVSSRFIPLAFKSTLIIEFLLNFAGDRLLTTDSASEHWAYPEDKKINLSYPINGESAEVITYLEVFTEQVQNQRHFYLETILSIMITFVIVNELSSNVLTDAKQK